DPRVGKGHRRRHVHVAALAREERMRLHADPHVEVARGAPTRLAGALRRADRTVLHAGRHLDRHLLDLRHHPVARADRAGLLDAPPRSAAGRARPRDAEEAALVAHLASALARRTAPDSRPWRRAASATRVAGLPARDLDRLLRAERRFFEADLELDLDVAPGPGATAAEDAAEQALEDLADRSEVHLLVGIVTAARLESRVPHPVVAPALLVVAEDRVGLAQLLEARLGRRVPRVAVRVALHRELAEGPLDLVDRKSTRLNSSHVKISY